MARGWESKSVEDQQTQYQEAQAGFKPRATPTELARRRVLDGLTLNRQRILQQLETAQNVAHRTTLEKALSHLDAEITRLR